MRPKPRLSLPLPLPVGAAGCEELAVVEVPDDQPGTAAALRELRAAAPPGLTPLAIVVVGDQRPRPQELIDLIATWAEVDPVMRGLKRRRIIWKGLPPGPSPGAERNVSR